MSHRALGQQFNTAIATRLSRKHPLASKWAKYPVEGDEGWSEDFECSDASQWLAGALREKGYPAEVVSVDHPNVGLHSWVKVGDQNVDITARQFHWRNDIGEKSLKAKWPLTWTGEEHPLLSQTTGMGW